MNLKYSIQIYQESLYLLISNRSKCEELLNKEHLDENDMIDIYVSLHIVLETSLNALHRQIIKNQIIKPIDELEVTNNIDKIGFIEKTILFIYNTQFKFNGDLEKAATHHKIIGKMRNFAGVRNKLLHGHSISSLVIDEKIERKSDTRLNLEEKKLKTQIKNFIEINEGMRFFLDHVDNESWSGNYIEDLKKQYLSYDFLPGKYK